MLAATLIISNCSKIKTTAAIQEELNEVVNYEVHSEEDIESKVGDYSSNAFVFDPTAYFQLKFSIQNAKFGSSYIGKIIPPDTKLPITHYKIKICLNDKCTYDEKTPLIAHKAEPFLVPLSSAEAHKIYVKACYLNNCAEWKKGKDLFINYKQPQNKKEEVKLLSERSELQLKTWTICDKFQKLSRTFMSELQDFNDKSIYFQISKNIAVLGAQHCVALSVSSLLKLNSQIIDLIDEASWTNFDKKDPLEREALILLVGYTATIINMFAFLKTDTFLGKTDLNIGPLERKIPVTDPKKIEMIRKSVLENDKKFWYYNEYLKVSDLSKISNKMSFTSNIIAQIFVIGSVIFAQDNPENYASLSLLNVKEEVINHWLQQVRVIKDELEPIQTRLDDIHIVFLNKK